jgi:anti-sigma regulatory factor (Ser/Thr protein kinase)
VCLPSDPPPIPVARTPVPPVGPAPAPTPKAPVPAQRPGLPRLPRPRPGGTERLISGYAQQFVLTPTAAGWARRHTADVLARWGLPELADDCCLVVSELIGNAVKHAVPGRESEACRLVLKLLSDAVCVEVWDPSPDTEVRPRGVEPLSESGRGLAIVAALCGTPPMVFAVPGAGKAVVAVIPRGAQ